MKRFVIVLFALAMAMSMSTVAFAADGAAMFKTKCAMCHGPEGQGKIGPKIAGKDAATVADVLSKGGQAKPPHTGAFSMGGALSADQIQALATYVSGLK
jgi:mono/diheme cytochrome c family protein